MALRSHIEWTDASWNPVTGCTKVSEGCRNCYAERLAKRLQAMGNPNYRNGFKLTLHPHMLDLPLKWKRPRMIFVNSMSDLFHNDVPTEFIMQVFDTMIRTPRHIYQVLTKRSSRLKELASILPWQNNIWAGVTVESNKYLYRIDDLRAIPAHVRFVSAEPLIGPLHGIGLSGVHWVIVGGESGPRARVMRKEWVEEIRDQCTIQKVPFFFKQWGGTNKKKAGRELDGQIWSQMPATIEVALG